MALTYSLIAVAVVIVAFVVVVAMQPADFVIERKLAIAASPPDIFAHVNDLHRWEAWSPWAKLDPDMKQTYEGAPTGAGAVSSWSGNNKVGEGRMTITDSRPSECIQMKLEFFRPFKATNLAQFAFQPDAGQTVVTWSMTGTNNFMSKAFCLFMNMDKLVGGDFDKGLAQLKSVVERPSPR